MICRSSGLAVLSVASKRPIGPSYSPLHVVMNATFILTGMLILIGLAPTHSVWPRRHLTTWGLIMLGVAGAGTILVGLSPENVHMFIHVVGAVNIPAATWP